PYLPRLAPWMLRYMSHARAGETRRIAAALAGVVADSLADHQALATGTGAEKWLVPSDYLYLYKNRAAFEADAFGWAIRHDHGFRWDELEGMAFRSYDPVFSPDLGFAVRMGGHGHITDPGRYVKDLARHVVANGGQLLKGEVTDLVRENGRVTGVRASGTNIDADAVVIATGVWSKPLARKLGIKVPLETERGYHLELIEPSFMPRAPVMHAAGKFVITPMDGRLRLAGIVEFGGLAPPPSKAPFALLRRNIRAAMPRLTWKDEVEWMGHRPAPSDSIPVIGEVPGADGAFLGFGHHHIGLTAGPKTGRILAQMIVGTKTNLDVSAYSPARFL
ncbi:MAG TPA: FAD-binding oxidoreductase, partial [Rhodobacteraceae bacterium]|nr:FAD-binding oxidoreductase [Paracoccaceae bacterium]